MNPYASAELYLGIHGDEGIEDYTTLEPAELVQRIRDAGIAGMGGAGFPAAVKLSLQPGTHIETLIINGTECEPYITSDDILMRERAAQIVEGAKILARVVQLAIVSDADYRQTDQLADELIGRAMTSGRFISASRGYSLILTAPETV